MAGDFLRRVEALEQRIDPQPSAGDFHIIVCRPDETPEDARARYFRDRPPHPASTALVIQLQRG